MAKRLTEKRVFAFVLATVAGVAFAAAILLPVPPAAAALRRQSNQNRPVVADDETPRGNGNKPTPNSNVPRPPRVKLYEVVFVMKMPDVEVFLKAGGMQTTLLGKSVADGMVKTRLAVGRHQILASRPGYQILSTTVDVRPRSNQFDLTIQPVPVAKKVEPEPVVETPVVPEPQRPAKTPEEEAAEKAARVAQTVANFIGRKPVPASDWDFVLAQTGAALARDPANTSLQAQALLAQGQLAFLRSDYPNARDYFNKAVLIEPNLLPALYGLGNAHFKSGQYADAFKAYQRAKGVNADFAPAYQGIRDALVMQNKSKEAKQYDEKFRSLGGAATPDERLNDAVGLMKAKQWRAALDELKEVVKTRDTAQVHILIGDCHEGMNKPLSAADSYRRATELDRSSALAHSKYGETMFEYNEYGAAYEALKKSLELDPSGTVIDLEDTRKMADKALKKMKSPKSK